ncbi:hypothetical protein N7532_003469 [Penicillium argentinense]|uniref:Protein kinase domain-containing protein n=1 Tax=Penicillium argentinense TaxID=1131581 RepID=A0A9W9FMH8_9EURO|nr:uncharacterized protein N7532_003469 [Penicillium argentinense]KAJ5102940.1 hypothetical protein N7532_003469 [Penicillium argentinense]
MGSLRDYMKKCHPIRTKLIMMGDVGAGLMALHKCGIVHGDLKMDNVVVFASLDRPSGTIAKVSDFGHSILVSSAPEKRTQYFGTTLYNSPEVAQQKTQPILVENLHKCDIWAFGLCAWEILADGQVYFQRSWKHNPQFERSARSESLATPTDSETQEDSSIDGDDQHVFGRFDLSYLRILAGEFVNNMKIPGIGFEKGFLRPLMDRTLQVDPSKRVSDLNRLPIIGFWNKMSGAQSLQSKLATYAISGDIRYSIFSRDIGPNIIWEQQKQLLIDFEAVAEKSRPDKSDGSAAFQTMLCYVNNFGTSQDLTKATQYIRKAEEAGHLIARILGSRMLDGFSATSTSAHKSYSECLALGFSVTRKVDASSSLTVHNGEEVVRFPNYESFRKAYIDMISWEAIDKVAKVDFLNTFVTQNLATARFHPLEIVVRHGDIELLEAMLSLTDSSMVLEQEKETLVAQAAACGYGKIACRLLSKGAIIAYEISTSILHWLFCLDISSVRNVQQQLENTLSSSDLRTLVNRPCPQRIVLHPQWPFQVHGTPLATAVATGNIEVVKSLLEMGADPAASAFTIIEGDTAPKFTPIHLAVRYHNAKILQLLWEAEFGKQQITGTGVSLVAKLGSFPMGCALSLLTNAERLAIHGKNHKQKLKETIDLLALDILLQSSPEGLSAIFHAIDLEDVDAVELLLAHFPALATRKLVQPDDQKLFTYPLHFAVQIGANRDTDEAIRIVEHILKLDPTALNRGDSSSVKPIHIAAMGSSTRMLNYLLDRGASYGDLDGRKQNALHFCRTAENVKILLLGGTRIDHKDQLRFTPAHAAAIHGMEEVLQALIDAGANLSFADNENGTPLHCAIRRKSRSMIEMLLKAGVNADAPNIHGKTPLLVAMDIGRADIAALLFDHGANPFTKDTQGLSPFHVALRWESSSTLTKFQLHREFDSLSWDDKIKVLWFAARNGHHTSLRLFLSKIIGSQWLYPQSPAYQYRDSISKAIHIAVKACQVENANALLSFGVRVDTPDSRGNTPLLLACQIGRLEQGFNPYHRAYMCEMLVNNGADILARNHSYQTIIALAQAYADFPLMTLLLEHTLNVNNFDQETKRNRIIKSIRSDRKGEVYNKEAEALIGNESIKPGFLRSAAAKSEWEFVMTCLAGQFMKKEKIKEVFGAHRWPTGVDSIDMMLYYSVNKDRNFVAHLYKLSNKSIGEDAKFFHRVQIGRRDLDVDLDEAREMLNSIIWPEKQDKDRINPLKSLLDLSHWPQIPDEEDRHSENKEQEEGTRKIWTGWLDKFDKCKKDKNETEEDAEEELDMSDEGMKISTPRISVKSAQSFFPDQDMDAREK